MRVVKVDRLVVALSIFSGLLVSLGRSTQVYPQSSSGNGNLGLIPLLLLLLIFPFGISLVVQWMRAAQLRFLSLIGLSICTMIYLVCGIFYQVEQFSQYQVFVKQQVRAENGTIDESYLTSITSVPSPYMNSQFFNSNTFLIYWASILLVASLIAWWTRNKSLLSDSDKRNTFPFEQ
ncbi:hypothetical protein RSA42_05295 [Exiguobacterium indicum]|uniref:hypothetical protein n=1 Tax=Exiguobacterium indicum TaxID=296995 RepID=UPI000737710D|nr:hypothetical protein [Exiguobacterium indicum]KTR61336.1 hypothetical protein RSA42_05295 [Exiguobacterium indicum]